MGYNMPLIAGVYRIIGKIGSGGGGIVYLAEHLRLNKKVVLKADKRTLSIKPEYVRREVDALKDLSHSHIPQVYDIALALGEEGAIAVAATSGYSSPEHYGLDYSSGGTRNSISPTIKKTVVLPDSQAPQQQPQPPQPSQSPQPQQSRQSSDTSTPRTIMLTSRSDIYSLGATLYHILTGVHPAQNAPDVTRISDKNCSSAVIAVITKAMNPDQNLRYQSAEEMLYAFEHLRENDIRTKRYKWAIFSTVVLLGLIFLAAGFTAFEGLRTPKN